MITKATCRECGSTIHYPISDKKEPEMFTYDQVDTCARHESPLEIELALHYYSTPSLHRIAGNKIHDEIMGLYVQEGLFGKMTKEPSYYATAKGNAWIKAICSTPFPVCEWVIPTNGYAKPPVAYKDQTV